MSTSRRMIDDATHVPLDATATALRVAASASRVHAALLEAAALMVESVASRHPNGKPAREHESNVADLDDMRTRGP